MTEHRRDPLRFWWVAPFLVVLLMLASWALFERPVIGRNGDTRFLVRPEMDLDARESGSDDAWLRIDWRSTHDGDVRYRELDLSVDGSQRAYVGHDPAEGQWSALREDLYLSSAERVREGDIIVVGGGAALSGSRLRVVVDPCDCDAAVLRLA